MKVIDPTKEKRSAIMIFNLGAPSQLDTFDMKPDAPAEIRGPFKPISTAKGASFQVSEILPLHAKIADKFRSSARVFIEEQPSMIPVGKSCKPAANFREV